MPLLKKKPFNKVPIPENIRDDEEVFHCAATNEIFRDYEDFSERMFLCNSMVWTCSLTGKANLTYSEALESEENAKNSLKEFPSELRIPVLYLATKTKRTAFGDMADDIYVYIKDRYFIGENIETSFTGSKWKDSHVLQVISPPTDKTSPTNTDVCDRSSCPAASLYKYEIEHLDADDQDISEIMIVDCNQIRRKKGLFSREKCKLFLKQYVEQNERGLFVVKPSIIEAFKLNQISFDQIFDGPSPEFDTSKRFEKVVNGKKTRQESLHKFLTKNAEFGKSATNGDLLEKMRKKEEEFKLIKQQKKEQELEMKQKKKEENMILSKYLRNWYKPKEDLELVDQQILPEPSQVSMKIGDEHLGDTFMVLEFVKTFSKLLSSKDFFPGGLSLEIMERALTENEVAGPFTDLVQMFLIALFNVQDQEASQYRTETENPSSIKQDEDADDMNLREATRLATIASTWSKEFQGLSLGELPLYSLTTSEILRLHLLSSGAIINNTGARWRYQQRGGYTSEDDPGLYLRLHSPHILKSLKTHNIVELPISDKIQILSCLINQLLTYADVRDIVEERIEKIRQAKTDYKLTLTAEKRREQEFLTARYKMKKIAKTDPKVSSELHKLEVESNKKKAQNERKLEELQKVSYENQIVMGHDRAFQQYLKLESIPGFFVNSEEENTGMCLNNIVEQIPHLVGANREETLAYIKQTMQDSNSSDKENSPSKIPKKVNGVVNGVKEQKTDSYEELLLCSTDSAACIVHSSNKKNRWCFYRDEATFQQLIDSLNKRGVRENELQQNLKNNKQEIEKLIINTPISILNPELSQIEESKLVKKTHKSKYENANLGYSKDLSPADILQSALIESVLEMEEKIFAGNLGSLCVKDREKWRNCLLTRNYKDFDKKLVQENDEKPLENGDDKVSDLNLPDDFSKASNVEHISNGSLENVSEDGKDDIFPAQSSSIQEAIHCLSVALAQVARSVGSKFLKKPLGRMGSGRNKKKENVLHLWEESLLTSTSFSQIFLHYSTLDSCIMWSKSVLLTRCRICRRRNDSENMLLCTSCNLGHHLSCLKPKLKSVPSGDWFCNKCRDEQKPEAVVLEHVPKKRPIFRDEEIDEMECEEEIQNNESNNDSEDVEEDEEQDHDHEGITAEVDLCKTCGSGGEVIHCEKCSNCYHIECVEPPLRRAPRGPWFCISCKKINDRKRHNEFNQANGDVVQRTGKMNGQRRCAAQALYKIHDFIKTLRQLSESDDSSEEEVVNKRSSRRDDGRSDLPLHNSALHAVLSEIMKNYNAWPFLRPVQKTEVPDYYDVITKPMDFGTIKYKLNMGEYQEDAQFMSDALLIFQNCNTYNHTEDDVYKCGVELLKHFQRKCRELGLKLPEELDYDSRPKKRIRTK